MEINWYEMNHVFTNKGETMCGLVLPSGKLYG